MNKQAIIHLLTEKYSSFIDYINTLSTDEYLFDHEGKWTAGQQAEHIVLCVKPLVQVFSMDKAAIAQNFGVTKRESRTYDVLLNDYKEQLNEGGKAPGRYLPATVSQDQKEILNETLSQNIKELCARIETFNEQELDSLLIPHPLLGKLTLREMLYNAAYHVEHHQTQAQENLKYVI
ncbi:DinB family protein [Chitinophagaceae bacterium MMS25-I14]